MKKKKIEISTLEEQARLSSSETKKKSKVETVEIQCLYWTNAFEDGGRPQRRFVDWVKKDSKSASVMRRMQGIGWEAGRWSKNKFALPHVVFPVYVSISFIVSCAASELSEKKNMLLLKKRKTLCGFNTTHDSSVTNANSNRSNGGWIFWFSNIQKNLKINVA